MTKSEQQAEAVVRARTGQSFTNYPAIVRGFMDKGIVADDIKPRENVFTFHAWKALGRVVKKGEHGVRIPTFIDCAGKETDDTGEEKATSYRRPRTTTVFHVSQTEPLTEKQMRNAENKERFSRRYRSDRAGYGRSDFPANEDEDSIIEPVTTTKDKADRWNERQF